MKKLITGLLALLSCCTMFTACDFLNKNNASDSTPDASVPSSSVPEESETPGTSVEETDPHVEALQLAKDFVYGDLIEKDLEVSKDYKLLKSTYSFILEENLSVSWTVDVTEGVTLIEGETEWTVDVDEFAEEDIFYTLTGTISDSDGHTISFTLDRKVLKAADVVPEKITEAPVEGEAYKLYMYQVTKKVDLYFTGAMSGYYLATNNTSKGEGYEKAVDVFVENVEGKDGYFYICFNEKTEDSDGNVTFVKQYFGISNTHNDKGWHVNAIYSPTNVVADGAVGTYEFTWSEQYDTFIATVEGVTYEDEDDNVVTNTSSFYFGTYSTYYTIGTSHVDNFDNDDACIVYLSKMVTKSEVPAEDKVASEKETLSVTTAFSGAVEYTLPTQGTTYGDVAISWALKSDNATLTDNVLTLASPEAELKIVLTATFTCGEATVTKDVEITVYPKSLVTLVSDPQEGTAYAFYLYQANKAKNYYLTGEMAGNFLGTTDDATKAADVYAEKADNGIKIYVLNGETKSYIKLTEYESSGKYKASVSLAEDGSVFTYNSQFSMWTCNTGNDVFYLGTYNDFTTMSASAASYVKVDNVGKTQFCANFGILDESAITPPAGGEGEGGDVIVPSVTTSTIATILASADGEYQAEGTVVAVTAKSFLLKDSTGKILVYLNAAPSVKVGDKVTVKGNTEKYNGAMQFKSNSVVTFVSEGSVGMQIATSLTATDVDACATNVSGIGNYVQVAGMLEITSDNKYDYVTVDGATAKIRISYPTTEIKAILTKLNGEEISVEGYIVGVGTKDNVTYVHIAATSVRATDEGIGDEKPGEGEEECKHNYVDGVCTECGAADPDYKPEEEKPEELTAEEILNQLYALADGETATGEFTLTGTITAFDNYKNPTIVVEGFENMPVLCYYFTVNNASIGDTLTVTATGLKNYKGTYEFTSCTLVELIAHTHNYGTVVTAPTCTADGYTTYTCTICKDTYKADETTKLGHTTENGLCDNCGQEISPENPGLTEKSYAYTFGSKQFDANGTKTLNDVEWTVDGQGGNYWGYDAKKGQQLGSKNAPYTSLTVTSEEFSNVSKITINTSGASGLVATCDVYVGDTKVGTITLTTTATEYSFDVAGLTGEIKLVYSITTAKGIYVKSLAVEYAE